MADLATTTRKLVMHLLNLCLRETKEVTPPLLAEGYMERQVPADLNPPADRHVLVLLGKEYWFYKASLDSLCAEPSLEYLDRGQIDKLLWHLVCETTGSTGNSRTVQGNKKRLTEFTGKHAREILEYEVMIPIDHLDTGEKQLQVRTVLLRRMTSADLREWGIKIEKTLEELNARTFAVTKEKGTNPKKVIERARKQIGEDFDILVAALAARRQIWDEQLMFDLAEIAFAKDPSGVVHGWWERSYKPIDILLAADSDEELSKDIKSLTDFLGGTKVAPKMKERLKVCLANLRKAAQAEKFDDKVNFLFSGLEALLQTRDDRAKGEAIAARLMLLSTEATGKFFDPALTLALYDLRRSRTIHGEKIDLAHEKEYQDLLIRTNEAIRAFVDIVGREKMNSRPALFEWLLKQGKVPNLIAWLKGRDSEDAERLKKWFEDQTRSLAGPAAP